MIYFNMNNQLKLLLYIVFLAAVFIYVQDTFNIFNISFSDTAQRNGEVQDIEEREVVELEEVNVVEEENYVEIFISGGESIRVDVDIADTDLKRARGLSNRRYLGDYDGMLFIFDEMLNRPFWMKDMLIGLDILFIDDSGFIVDIVEDNEPCTEYYCPQIVSSRMYKYVLEVNAGFCELNGVEVGQSIVMHLARSR